MKKDIDFKNFRAFDITTKYEDVFILNPISGKPDFKNGDNLTISDYLEINVSKGSENIYIDLVVYIDQDDKPLILKIYTKENKEGIKELIKDIIKQS